MGQDEFDFNYERKPLKVLAVQWRGDNRAEIEAFFFPDYERDEIGLRFRADDYPGSDIVQFSLWNDDQEVSIGWWIVRYCGTGDDHGTVMTESEFQTEFWRRSPHHA